MTPQPGEALPLSDEEEAALRRFAARYGDGSFGGDIKRLLATLDREREHAQTCLMCQRADDINARAALAANQPVAEEQEPWIGPNGEGRPSVADDRAALGEVTTRLVERLANQPVAEERTCRCGHAERSHEPRGCLSCRCQRFRPVNQPVAEERTDVLTLAMKAHRPTEFDLVLDPEHIADLLADPEHDIRCAADGEPWPCAARRVVPGLPSSFPVGSVSGSPKLPHAYNVREEEG